MEHVSAVELLLLNEESWCLIPPEQPFSCFLFEKASDYCLAKGAALSWQMLCFSLQSEDHCHPLLHLVANTIMVYQAMSMSISEPLNSYTPGL